MADVFSIAKRSELMARIRGKDTAPEMRVRRLLFKCGYRYRLHAKDLPGRPDIVFRSRRKIIFVHGCYWHMHSCRRGRVAPQTREAFWQAKRLSNVARDERQQRQLRDLGYEVLVVWECETRDATLLAGLLSAFLS